MAPEKAISIERLAIPIGLAVTMLATAVGTATYIGGRMTSIEHRMEMLSRDIREAAAHAESSLLRHEFAAWRATLAAANATLSVPELAPR